jgi:phosphatidylserine decarboxylase
MKPRIEKHLPAQCRARAEEETGMKANGISERAPSSAGTRERLRALEEDVFFLLTNRIPRRLATRFFGWFSQIEQPQVRDLSLWLWQRNAELRLDEAKKTHFDSLHDCFVRELREGARPLDLSPEVLVSPCDGVVGGFGRVEGVNLIQAKGFAYTLLDLLVDDALVEKYRNGSYVTLRLTASMYHRFHAPHDCSVERVTYISGDTWNTHPVALARVEKLFCKNERAVVRTTLSASGHEIVLVPVAAILVASLKLHCLDVMLRLSHKGPNEFTCSARYRKGDEMGWFQHGSTIIVFAPRGVELDAGLRAGKVVRMGEPLLRLA